MNLRCRRRSAMLGVLIVACALPLVAAAQVGGGWIKAGTHPNDYEMGVDPQTAFTGASSGFIRSAKAGSDTFGTYMQSMAAAEYRGKRVRMTAYVKTENVKGMAGVWLRVDAGIKPVAFDNMMNRPLSQTNPWTPVSIVLDVDPQATVLAFGILLAGQGSAWIDDVSFEAVGNDVPITDMLKVGAGTAPRNLDFESNAATK